MSNIIDIVIRADNRTGAGLDEASKSGNVLKGVFQGIGQAAGNILAELPMQAIGFFKGAIDSASDLGETVSKNQTIFGAAANDLIAWAESAPKALGMTKQAALDATGTLGNLFTQLGVTSDEARKLSQSNVQLATDFASFHNADPTEVLEAMTAAFRGEYDEVQRFVPVLNAAKVEEEALAMTHKKSAKELTEKDKALATSAIMTKNAGAATGDFARTSDSAANKTRIAAASFEELKAKIGSVLLPAWSALLSFITGSFFPAIERVGSWLGGTFGPILDSVAGAWTMFSNAFQSGLTEDEGGWNTFAERAEQVGLILRQVFGGIKDAWLLLTTGFTENELDTNLGDLGEPLKSLADSIRSLVAEWLPRLQAAWTTASESAVQFWAAIKGNENVLIVLAAAIGIGLVAALYAATAALVSFVASAAVAAAPFILIAAAIFALVAGLRYAYENFEWFRTAVDGVVQWLVTTVPPIFEQVRAAIAFAFQWITTVALPPVLAAFGTFIVFLQGTLLPAVISVWNGIVAVITFVAGIVMNIVGRITAFISDNWNWIAGIAMAIWDQITNVISNAWQIISNLIQLFLNIITGNWGAAWGNIKNITSATWDLITGTIGNAARVIGNLFMLIVSAAGNMVGGVAGKMFELGGWFAGLPGRILGALGNIGSWLYDSGARMISGLWDGIASKIGWVKDRIAGGLGDIRRLFPFSPAKEGPFSGSGYTDVSGAHMAEDLALGFASRQGMLSQAVGRVMTSMQQAFTPQYGMADAAKELLGLWDRMRGGSPMGPKSEAYLSGGWGKRLNDAFHGSSMFDPNHDVEDSAPYVAWLKSLAAGGGMGAMGGTTHNWHVQGSILSERDLVRVVRDELTNLGLR